MRLLSTLNLTNESPAFSFFGHWKIFLTSVLVLIILFTVTGNILTLLAVFRMKMFKNSVSNLYIASLAGADLIVGFFVMPVMLIFSIGTEGQWPLGPTLCDIWQAVDYCEIPKIGT